MSSNSYDFDPTLERDLRTMLARKFGCIGHDQDDVIQAAKTKAWEWKHKHRGPPDPPLVTKMVRDQAIDFLRRAGVRNELVERQAARLPTANQSGVSYSAACDELDRKREQSISEILSVLHQDSDARRNGIGPEHKEFFERNLFQRQQSTRQVTERDGNGHTIETDEYGNVVARDYIGIRIEADEDMLAAEFERKRTASMDDRIAILHSMGLPHNHRAIPFALDRWMRIRVPPNHEVLQTLSQVVHGNNSGDREKSRRPTDELIRYVIETTRVFCPTDLTEEKARRSDVVYHLSRCAFCRSPR